MRSDYGSRALIGADRTPEFEALPQTQAALAYAERLHEGQLRAVDGAPFIVHSIEVGVLLHECGAVDEVIAGGCCTTRLRRPTRLPTTSTRGSGVGSVTLCVRSLTIRGSLAMRVARLRCATNASAGVDALTVFAADQLSKVRELPLDNDSGIKVRDRKLSHYWLSLALLRERLPGSPLVAALAAELNRA